ncbi:MAG: class I SAM-dependent rRNA methyltransferase [Candidatus Jettenia sp.]|nr:class I SAM-dependent rRNA methyltransferase [Candidatus Jettenia sp. AMX1]MBC6929191.1 class I SAM-dependent rRNA methyltransferase [Candidatus Jettenia sp.]NUN23773.1 class I SAM-dependent rRNA methyltransferase [Candidatus Jettenia caeni]KAA0250148.1 MAG: class I SAM-dependent rRNA methyltransferase [Candidatus Jettenia sp. AMX1]MCE7880576.1 class I SAM-dependent rRNA methyltransferase [Candidatus Jettenia sp. AMX1]MCQ3927377.1 class I SAM-dependent rRNA methyltransferase [Candidatus Jet
MTLPVISLKAKRNSLHPWIFDRMIRHPQKRLKPGMLVEVVSKEGVFIGRGIYNYKSNIGIRLLTEDASEPLNKEFFLRKLQQAKTLREEVLGIQKISNSYRLIHGESDGLSGLIIDKFADVFVIEPYSAGYVGITEWIVSSLQSLYPGARVAVRPDERTAAKEGIDFLPVAKDYPGPDSVEIKENLLQMRVNLETGHKTGFFLDQRENRLTLSQYCSGKEVLDCFCYTGGFAISAMLMGAKSATGIDLDEKALEMALENARLNTVKVTFQHVNVFDYLRTMHAKGEQTDVLILDPAKLAGHKDEMKRAHRTYGDINRLGMQVIRPGGILLTCSCSGLVSEKDFLSILTRSAAEAGVVLQIFKVAGASSDHPFSTIFPEGRYLKAVFARVFPYIKKGIEFHGETKHASVRQNTIHA